MREKLQIWKIGGKLLNDSKLRANALQHFVATEGPKILVHGGGPKANELMQRLNLVPRMRDGRRITDEATLEIVVMVYAGLLNKNLVSQLQGMGCNALGLSGADGNTIQANLRPPQPIDYGFAGDVEKVNVSNIQKLLSAGFTPVFCAITHDGIGQLLNTNADTIAAQLAIALAPVYEVSLNFCFEKAGVLAEPLDDTSVIVSLDTESFSKYQEEGVISRGMLPKLHNAFEALSHQVAHVHIGSPESISKGLATTLNL